MAMRPGPTTWFVGPDGDAAGFDRELVALFAREVGLPLRIVPADSALQLFKGIASGEVQIGAGGLIRPASAANERSAESLLYSNGYYAIEPVLVYNSEGFKPESWADLTGETVGIVEGTGLEATLAKVRGDHPDVQWRPLALPAAEGLIEQVSEGSLGYAVVASNEAALVRNVFLNVETAFPVGPRQELVWVVSAKQAVLLEKVNAFFARIAKDGTLQRLIDRYFGHVRRVERIGAGVFQERIRTVLPAFTALFHQAQQESGIEWRLIAAIAYQESHWDPQATSETNVRGMMMLTEDTAKRLRVRDRLDARQSIGAGARYLAELKRSLPARIAEPDRTWIALAAFNIGIGHLEDARVLAVRRKLNPDSWSDIKKTLPLLAQADLADDTRFGVARGGQAVVFVETVRAYYDVLLRLEKPYYGARLQATQ
ncbi:MAG: membrane-bound lytic murein transglycosylase MltF [Betaproteobacteria bacterium]|nr:MAG: membrane-bound lytic murein transglycosylase MltF [Betaproteobacteria bacterium]